MALVTCRSLPYLTEDDRLLLEPLRSAGIDGRPATWDDPGVDWSAFDCVVVRSTWDYHVKPDRFRRWVDLCEASAARLWNPAGVLRWNMDKRYLRDLEARGVDVVPTEWVGRGSEAELSELLEARGWERAVVKPAVSAGARRTSLVGRHAVATAQATLDSLVSLGDVMVQPFLDGLQREGEWSLLFLGGAFSHAALKFPAAGDFRVQERFGGTARRATASRSLIRQAEAVVEAARAISAGETAGTTAGETAGEIAGATAGEIAGVTAATAGPTAGETRKTTVAAGRPALGFLYARVDGVVEGGRLLLLELELLEPSLFLALDPDAPPRLARAIAERLP